MRTSCPTGWRNKHFPPVPASTRQPDNTGAWPIGKAPIAADADLSAPGIGRIALPDAEKAIYGLAATEWMKSRGIHETLQAKLITAATVPQVTSYLVAGEVDAGFINVTDAIGVPM